LEIPAGALTEDTEITIRRLNDSEISEEFGDEVLDSAYELTPEGLNFDMPVRASVKLDDDPNLADGTLSADVAFLFSESGDVIEFLENTELIVDGTGSMTTVSADLTHFTNLITITENGVTATLDLPKAEDIPKTFTGTLTINSNNRIEDMLAEIAVNISGATLMIPARFGNLPFPLSGGMATATIDGKCLEEKEDKFVCVTLQVEQIDISTIFTFDATRPEADCGPIDELDVGEECFGFVGAKMFFETEIVCKKTEEGDTPPPPPPPPPTEPPVVLTLEAIDIDGRWNFDCSVFSEFFLLIEPNLGDPFSFQVDTIVNPDTLETMIRPFDEIFELDGFLMQLENGDFSFSGDGMGFLGDTNPGAANIILKAEDWNYSLNVPGPFSGDNQPGDVFVEGVLRFNFPTFPLNGQSSLAECVGIKTGD